MRRRRKFSNSFYRNTNSCTYNYDLATSSLFGPGDYSAYLVINSVAVLNPGRFRLE